MTGSATTAGDSARLRVYELLRRRIISLDLPPGTALSENELSTSLRVSRTPIREAILLLIQDGLVQVYPKVGTFVTKVDLAAVAEAQFLREAVEVASLRSLEYPLDQSAVSVLTDILDQQDASTGDAAGFFALDEQFHESLMALAGHRGLWATVSQAKAHLDRARRLGLRHVSSLTQLAAHHHAVLDAVIKGDLDQAEERLRSHLSLVFGEVDAIRATSPELFASDVPTVPVRRSVAVWE